MEKEKQAFEEYSNGWKIMLDVIETGESDIGKDRLMVIMSRSSAVNYAQIIRHDRAEIESLKAALKALLEGVNNLPPLTAIEGALTAQCKKAEQLIKQYGG